MGWMTNDKFEECNFRVWRASTDDVRRQRILDRPPIHKSAKNKTRAAFSCHEFSIHTTLMHPITTA